MNTDAKILNLRILNGGSVDRCPTCGHSPENPYRRVINGKIIEGCVDATHTGRLPVPSASSDWHMRPEAIEVRMNSWYRIYGVL